MQVMYIRSSHPELFLGKGVLKICSKITEDRQCWYAVLIKLLCHFIEITLQHWCSPVNSRHIFRTPFLMSTSRWLQSEHVLSNMKLKPNYFVCQKRELFCCHFPFQYSIWWLVKDSLVWFTKRQTIGALSGNK